MTPSIRSTALAVALCACGGPTTSVDGGAEIPSATLLAGARDRPFSVTADSEHVYWSEYRVDEELLHLYRAPRAGGEPELLHTQFGGIGALALHDDGLFFTSGGLQRLDLETREVREVQRGDAASTDDLVARGGRLYWATWDGATGRVRSLRPDGTDAVVLGEREGRPSGPLGLDATHVYWALADEGVILRSPREPGGATEVVAEDECARGGVAVDATHVYWHADPACTLTHGVTLRRAPRAGGAVEPLDEDISLLHQAADGVYFVDYPQTRLHRVDGPALGDFTEITRYDGSGRGSFARPNGVFVDAAGAFLVGYEDDEPSGLGWVATLPLD